MQKSRRIKEKVDLGDIVQLHSRKEGWHHSIIISVKESSKICYAGHSKRHKWANINKIKKVKINIELLDSNKIELLYVFRYLVRLR